MKKTTRATIKSFIKKQHADKNLYVKTKSSFDGMVDMVTDVQDDFRKVDEINMEKEYDFGIRGLWLVGGSRDWFKDYEDEKYIGYEIYNCCGSSLIVRKK